MTDSIVTCVVCHRPAKEIWCGLCVLNLGPATHGKTAFPVCNACRHDDDAVTQLALTYLAGAL